jgi:hypothetical protein
LIGAVSFRWSLTLIRFAARAKQNHAHQVILALVSLMSDLVESFRLLSAARIAGSGVELQQGKVGLVVIGIELNRTLKSLSGAGIVAIA